MALAVTLTDAPAEPPQRPARRRRLHATSRARTAPAFTADGPDPEAWMLFVHREPEIGMCFRYADLLWEVVDYRDGWIARMVVGGHPHPPSGP